MNTTITNVFKIFTEIGHREGYIVFRKAIEQKDFNKIHQFNHEIFAGEIHQHSLSEEGWLIDKFHNKNHYFIAERGETIIGLISAHWEPPYSIEDKCPNFYNLIPKGVKVGEIRLFAVRHEYRKTQIALRLITIVSAFLEHNHIDLVAISGIFNQKRLYEKLGFRAIDLPVRSGEALFIPMILTRDDFFRKNHWFINFDMT